MFSRSLRQITGGLADWDICRYDFSDKEYHFSVPRSLDPGTVVGKGKSTAHGFILVFIIIQMEWWEAPVTPIIPGRLSFYLLLSLLEAVDGYQEDG